MATLEQSDVRDTSATEPPASKATLPERLAGRLRDLSIRNKIVLLSLTTSAVAVILAATALLSYQLRLERQADRERLGTVAEVIGASSSAALSFGDEQAARTTLLALSAVNNVVAGCLYRSDDKLFATYERDAIKAPCPPTAGAHHDVKALRSLSGVSRVIARSNETMGSVAIYMRPPAASGRIAGYAGIAAVVLATSGLLAFIIASGLQMLISAPILDLVRTARRVSREKDYSIRAEGGGEDEVGQLLTAFNEMLDQIQQRDSELQAFTYTVSHDLRSPLRGLDGFSTMVIEDYGDRLDDQGRGYLTQIRNSARRMDALVSDLLRLARVTRAPMHVEPVDLSGLAGKIMVELRRADPQRAVQAHIQNGLTTIGDSGLLRAALSNLLDNAWKFTGRNDSTEIEFGTCLVRGSQAYFVRDNGVGFDMRYTNKLFTAFQRLHSVDEFPGTGIGLVTVHRIVRRHGGEVWCDAVPDGGATFYFTLAPHEVARDLGET